MNETQNYYVQNKGYWLKFLHRFTNDKRVDKFVFQKYFKPESIPELKLKVEHQFEDLLPEIPDFGRKKIDQFALDMMKSAQSLVFYQVLKAEGFEVRTIGQIMFEIAEIYYANLNPLVKFSMRTRCYSPSFQRKFKNTIEEQKGSLDPEDYHCDFVEGDQQNLAFGLNYTNCAGSYLLKKHDATEIHPYLCLCDYPMMRAFNIGFNRDQNIAIGGSMCTFRFYRNYPTPRGWPPEEVPEYKDFQFST
jgi:hypothetical protein